MASKEENENIIIHDWENNTEYTLLLSHQDCARAETDTAFANSLLFHARATAKPSTNSNSSPEIVANSALEAENSENLRTWGYSETITLIQSMGVHMEDLNHPKKRKEVFEHVSNDLVSSGYSFSIEAIKNKWKSLNRSYTKAKDNKNRTGRAPSRFMFYNEMDDIVGDKPSNKCNHSLNSLDDEVNSESRNTELEDNRSISTVNSIEDIDKTNPNKEKNHKRTTERGLKKEYIEMKKVEYERKLVRHEDRLKLEKDKLEIEKRKLKLLEEFVKQKQDSASN